MSKWSKVLCSAAVVVYGVQREDINQIGNTVPLTEAGYQLLAGQKNDKETGKFITRVALAEARTITDAGALSGLAPYYSGTLGVQSLENLKKELRTAVWVGEGAGRRAPLNQDGYQAVVSTNDETQMVAFARRILDANGKKSHDEGMLKGLVPWFTGKIAVQSFDRLQDELLSAKWTKPREEPVKHVLKDDAVTAAGVMVESQRLVVAKVHVQSDKDEKKEGLVVAKAHVQSEKDSEKKESKTEQKKESKTEQKKELNTKELNNKKDSTEQKKELNTKELNKKEWKNDWKNESTNHMKPATNASRTGTNASRTTGTISPNEAEESDKAWYAWLTR